MLKDPAQNEAEAAEESTTHLQRWAARFGGDHMVASTQVSLKPGKGEGPSPQQEAKSLPERKLTLRELKHHHKFCDDFIPQLMTRIGQDDHVETRRLLERLNLVSGGNAARGGGWIESDAYKHDGARAPQGMFRDDSGMLPCSSSAVTGSMAEECSDPHRALASLLPGASSGRSFPRAALGGDRAVSHDTGPGKRGCTERMKNSFILRDFLAQTTAFNFFIADLEIGWSKVASHVLPVYEECRRQSAGDCTTFTRANILFDLSHPENSELHAAIVGDGPNTSLDMIIFSYVVAENAVELKASPAALRLSVHNVAVLFLDSSFRMWPTIAEVGAAHGYQASNPRNGTPVLSPSLTPPSHRQTKHSKLDTKTEEGNSALTRQEVSILQSTI
ncbi:hypothetical protein GUITHDRAFT_141681 [Guillardia theta CCMP2712]|uniref:Uncharacterized protein n=1 Tax=Guillardia theta (strain CCMP2712) TaxID=905079 RepID=L1J1I8_GUITC|nr:hypothetical protein GUITHDRAFT_141681 [Guillardia theta CCMP2712]EKX41950.1 hypothetical protein GUITHDRAFT_141681 [Guillardia theta CCMP2712]|eukprot:XP_005828930.1 hypothetical protein GUITHDRAFT_141681 [Guillardia theta CCMP2712]